MKQPVVKRKWPAFPKIDWLKKNGGMLIAASLGLIGAFAGAYYGAASQTDIWRKEKLYLYATDLLAKRMEIIRNISIAETEASRMGTITKLLNIKQAETIMQLVKCFGADTCANGTAGADPLAFMLSATKETAEMHTHFFVNAQLAVIYFCDKTRSALKEWQGKNWWEMDTVMFVQLKSAMVEELQCGGLELRDILYK